jgi:hypothetical protein
MRRESPNPPIGLEGEKSMPSTPGGRLRARSFHAPSPRPDDFGQCLHSPGFGARASQLAPIDPLRQGRPLGRKIPLWAAASDPLASPQSRPEAPFRGPGRGSPRGPGRPWLAVGHTGAARRGWTSVESSHLSTGDWWPVGDSTSWRQFGTLRNGTIHGRFGHKGSGKPGVIEGDRPERSVMRSTPRAQLTRCPRTRGDLAETGTATAGLGESSLPCR